MCAHQHNSVCHIVVAMQKCAPINVLQCWGLIVVAAEPSLMFRLKGHFVTTPLFCLIAFLLDAVCGRIWFHPEQTLLKGMSGCLTSFSVGNFPCTVSVGWSLQSVAFSGVSCLCGRLLNEHSQTSRSHHFTVQSCPQRLWVAQLTRQPWKQPFCQSDNRSI